MKTPLPEIIATHIAPSLLERVVYYQGVLDAKQREELFKAVGVPALQIAERVVKAYDTQTPTLAFGLYEQVADGDWETARLLSEHFSSDGLGHLQASLVGRAPVLPGKDFLDFFHGVSRHVCLIVSQKPPGPAVRGTGFLVGPNLVLTCRHVLKGFLPDEDPIANGCKIELYFDFFHGDAVESVGPTLPEARRVTVDKKWHVASCNFTEPDGLEAEDLSEDEKKRIASALDFVLLQLTENVGLQPLEPGGGRRRGWIRVPDVAVPKALTDQDWIIIPQHPQGFPLRLGVGRYQRTDPTETRIRYSTGALGGSSGAPCFNDKFALVGIHNAFVGPQAKPLANQAIRFDWIAPYLETPLKSAKDVERFAPRWSIARRGEAPRVVIGRETLLKWLRASATDQPATLSNRLYAAHATMPRAGSSFSREVLAADLRDTKTPCAVYRAKGQQLPITAEDFLESLARELSIDLSKADPMPVRPGAPGALLDGEVDKVDRWRAEELPEWFGGVVTQHVQQTVDMREVARKKVKVDEDAGLVPDENLVLQAKSDKPILVRRVPWDYAYIVIDDLRAPTYQGNTDERTDLSVDVANLIAAMVKGKPEAAINPGLKRLRWMFLGNLPEILPQADIDGNGATLEQLDPKAVGWQDVFAMFDRMSLAYLPIADGNPIVLKAWSKAIVQTVDSATPPATTRMESIQAQANTSAAQLLAEVEN